MIGIASPLAGWVTPLDDVPDPVFAERMLGDGVAVDPVEGRVVAPGAGIVSSIHPAGHAVTLKLDSGPVLLIHVGLDTVALGGAGFTPRVKDGERVAEGDLLIEFDLDLLARRTRSLVTPVIVTNGDAFRVPSSTAEGAINLGQVLFKVEPTGSETGGGAWPLAAACAAACPFSQYDRAAEAPVPVSQYSVMLSRMWSGVRFPDGSPSTKAWEIL